MLGFMKEKLNTSSSTITMIITIVIVKGLEDLKRHRMFLTLP